MALKVGRTPSLSIVPDRTWFLRRRIPQLSSTILFLHSVSLFCILSVVDWPDLAPRLLRVLVRQSTSDFDPLEGYGLVLHDGEIAIVISSTLRTLGLVSSSSSSATV